MVERRRRRDAREAQVATGTDRVRATTRPSRARSARVRAPARRLRLASTAIATIVAIDTKRARGVASATRLAVAAARLSARHTSVDTMSTTRLATPIPPTEKSETDAKEAASTRSNVQMPTTLLKTQTTTQMFFCSYIYIVYR